MSKTSPAKALKKFNFYTVKPVNNAGRRMYFKYPSKRITQDIRKVKLLRKFTFDPMKFKLDKDSEQLKKRINMSLDKEKKKVKNGALKSKFGVKKLKKNIDWLEYLRNSAIDDKDFKIPDLKKEKISLWKKLASKKKLRTSELGFDLDLSIITPRIVAMSFPFHEKSKSLFFKNSRSEVKQYLDQKFGREHYLVVNLCAEPDK